MDDPVHEYLLYHKILLFQFYIAILQIVMILVRIYASSNFDIGVTLPRSGSEWPFDQA